MRHQLTIVFSVALLLGCDGDSPSSPITAPTLPADLTGTWIGELKVEEWIPPEAICPWMQQTNPKGDVQGVQASVNQSGNIIDLRFSGPNLVRGLAYLGSVDRSSLHATFEKSLSSYLYNCSPFSGFLEARVDSGSLDLWSDGSSAVSGVSWITFQVVSRPDLTPRGEPFSVRLRVSLHRAAS